MYYFFMTNIRVIKSFCFVLPWLFHPAVASAATDTPIGEVFCTTVDWMSGNLGIGLETLALMILGIGGLLGKMAWDKVIIEGAAIAAIFGAAQIVDAMTDSSVPCTVS